MKNTWVIKIDNNESHDDDMDDGGRDTSRPIAKGWSLAKVKQRWRVLLSWWKKKEILMMIKGI